MRQPGEKEAVLRDALEMIAAEREREREEGKLRTELDRDFGVLPGPKAGEPTPQGGQAPEVVLQEPMEEAQADDDEAIPERQVRGATPDVLAHDVMAKMHVTTPERPTKPASPVPAVTLAPVAEQAAQEEVPMAEPPEQEQVALEEDETGEAGVEVELPPLEETQILYGCAEKDLTKEQREDYEKRKSIWEKQEQIDRQMEHDEQIALQMQASEQRRADRPIQLGPPRRDDRVPPSAADEDERTGLAYGTTNLDEQQIVVTHRREEERPAMEPYQLPPFKPLAEVARQPSDEDEATADERLQNLRNDALLAQKISKEVEYVADREEKERRADREKAKKE